MDNILKLCSILQLAKEQPLTGYLTTGVQRQDLPSIASHLYTATLMGWFLVQKIKRDGGHINERKVIMMLLLHDLHNIFGGDISGPLVEKYKDLNDFKEHIGERGILLISQFLDHSSSDTVERLWLEMKTKKTDEAIVVDLIDWMEHQFFLEHTNYSQKSSDSANTSRKDFFVNTIFPVTQKIQNPHTKHVMEGFVGDFYSDFFGKGYQGMNILLEP